MGSTHPTAGATPYTLRTSAAPAFKKAISELLKRPENATLVKEAVDGLSASLAELLLEGLHVENRLNKSSKSGETLFKR